MGRAEEQPGAGEPTRPPEAGERRDVAGAAPAGRAPWALVLLLVGCLVALLAGIVLLSSGSARLPLLQAASATPTVTAPPPPSATRQARATIQLRATATLTAMPPGLRFALDPATIEYLPRAGRCDWSGVAGRALRRDGSGAAGIVVHLRQVDSGREAIAVTDARGNFELRLGDVPLLAPWQLQLRSMTGAELSDAAQIVTSEHCSQNLVVVEFNEQG